MSVGGGRIGFESIGNHGGGSGGMGNPLPHIPNVPNVPGNLPYPPDNSYHGNPPYPSNKVIINNYELFPVIDNDFLTCTFFEIFSFANDEAVSLTMIYCLLV